MIGEALRLWPTALWLCAAAGACLGLGFQAGDMARGFRRDPDRLAVKLGVVAFWLAAVGGFWATVGAAFSPVAALGAAYVSWSF